MNDTEPMKCAFARVLNDLTPGKYYLTNIDTNQIVSIEVSENPEKPNFIVEGMLIIPYGRVEASLSPSNNSIDFYSMPILGNSMVVACLNMLSGWTISKVKA